MHVNSSDMKNVQKEGNANYFNAIFQMLFDIHSILPICVKNEAV